MSNDVYNQYNGYNDELDSPYLCDLETNSEKLKAILGDKTLEKGLEELPAKQDFSHLVIPDL